MPRELVHRAAIAEVYLTSFSQTGEDEFEISAQWPRSHMFYRTLNGAVDSALLTETFRQATVLIAHLGYAVPLEHSFLMPDMQVTRCEDYLGSGDRPAELRLKLSAVEVRRTPKSVVGLRVDGTFTCDGTLIGRASAGARFIDPRSYLRYRTRHRKAAAAAHRVVAVEPSRVGAATHSGVLLVQSAGNDNWPLRVDVTHPVYFDHTLDHVPGAVLLEAARQAIRLKMNDPNLDFSQLQASFHSIAELDQIQTVTALTVPSSDGITDTWTVTIQSNEETHMTATFARVHSDVSPMGPRISDSPNSPYRGATKERCPGGENPTSGEPAPARRLGR
ncbi:MAG: hypothetical protein H7288_05555 [Kineosporiaceae bacterium]|nr:hypothetical protein [Aeromicrobium sp.]